MTYKNLVAAYSNIVSISGSKPFYLMLFFLLTGGFAEGFGLAILYPVFEFLENGTQYPYINTFLNQYLTNDEIIIIVLFFLVILFIIKGSIILVSAKKEANYAYEIKSTIINKLLAFHLRGRYSENKKRDESAFTNLLMNEVDIVIYKHVIPALKFLSEFCISSLIFLTIALISLKAALFLGFSVIVIALIAAFVNKNPIRKIGTKYSKCEEERSRYVLDIIGGYKDIIILNKSQFYLDRHCMLIDESKNYGASESFYYQFPRVLIEVIVTLIACILCAIYYLSNGLFLFDSSIILVLGIGFFRILPSLNRMVSSLQSILYSSIFMDNVMTALHSSSIEIDILDAAEINKVSSINLTNIRYSHGRSSLSDINLTLNNGDSLFIYGPSGSGKSTLVDLLVGLYDPDSGEISYFDETGSKFKPYPNLYSYVNQSPFLFNGTVRQNIYIGNEERKSDSQIIDNLGIYDLLDSNVRLLSGGQQKRVAIARALVLNRKILIFDEATNGLDENLTNSILQYIFKHHNFEIFIMISHDLKLMKYFSKDLRL